MIIGEEEIPNERALLTQEDGPMMASSASVKYIVIHCSATRHSWASIAQDRKVSTDIIREGLGHDNEKTTHIYLASISTSQIDRANQIILRGL